MLLLVGAALAGATSSGAAPLAATGSTTTGPAATAPSPVSGLLAALQAHLGPDGKGYGVDRHDGHGADGHDAASPNGCLTPLVNELLHRADELSPAERAWVTGVLMPWKADLLDPVTPLDGPTPPPGSLATEPCFSLGANRITSQHFAVEWDEGTISESTAQGFLTSLEEGYTVQVDELGWRELLQNDRYLVLAYVQEGDYQGAYTTVDYCGVGLMPYIVAYAGSFRNRSWGETMAVHELNHGLQFGYGFAWEFWWWEATATYIESLVYPDADWWADYVTGYTRNPHLAFNASDQNDQDIFWHMYGMAIWGFYLDEYQGGPDTVLATWEAARGERGTYTYGMDDAMEELGIDFDAAYTDFVVRNTVMDYAEQSLMPSVDERESIDDLPASGEVGGNDRPQGYGQTYLRFEAPSGDGGEGDLVVSFDGDDVPWSVQLVEVNDTDILRVVAADIVTGAGTVTLTGFGAEDVVLVASPLVDDDTKHGFAWSAEVVAPAADGDDDEKPSVCGYAPGGGANGPAGLGALLGLALLARRRR